MVTLFYSALLAYLWPLYINPDEDKNLRFYYLFTSEYWSSDSKPSDDLS